MEPEPIIPAALLDKIIAKQPVYKKSSQWK